MENYGNYLGVLKWSLAQNDGTKPSEVKPMTKEDQEFFDKAMKEACITDVARMKTIVDRIRSEDSPKEEKVTLLEDLLEYLENLDNAEAFDSIDGYSFLTKLLNDSKDDEIRSRCISLLSAASQNCLRVQSIILSHNVLQLLIEIIESTDSLSLKAKALTCISSIIRNNEVGEVTFISIDGMSIIQSVLWDESNSVLLTRKILLLLTELVFSSSQRIKFFLNTDLMKRLVSLYRTMDDVDVKESIIELINLLLKCKEASFEANNVKEELQQIIPCLYEYKKEEGIPKEIHPVFVQNPSKSIRSIIVEMAEKDDEKLNLSINIMPAKHTVSISVKKSDTILIMKQILSETINFPVESMKIVNGGKPCQDDSTIADNELNYCSKVICAAKGYKPEDPSKKEEEDSSESKLLIKMDNAKSFDVPYNIKTTWRELKMRLHKIGNIDPLDFVILLNDNSVNDNDAVVTARVNYMSMIHAVRTDFSILLQKPLSRSMVYLYCGKCKKANTTFVVRPVCHYCNNGFVVYSSAPFTLNETRIQDCFCMKGVCKNEKCSKNNCNVELGLAFYCKSCSDNTGKREPLIVLHNTSDVAEKKQQLNKLFGYLCTC